MSVGRLKTEADLARFVERQERIRPPASTNDSPGGDDLHKTVNFPADNTVTIQHNLGKRPAVTVMDSAGREWEIETKHLDENTVEWTVQHPFSGKATFN